MSQPAGNWFQIAIVAGALAGCVGNKTAEIDPNIFPAQYKQEILNTLAPMLVDPTNVRDAYVSEPTLTTVDKDQRFTVCVRYNPRDTTRRYTGSTDRIAYFYGGHINQLVAATKEQCGNAAYKPFPELEKLCLSQYKCS